MRKEKSIINILFISLFVLVSSFYLSFNFVSPKLTTQTLGFKGYTIVSNSMSPTINRGDIVFVKKTDIKNLKVNDIVAFSPRENKEVMHYVAKVEQVNNEYQIRTKREGISDKKNWDYWKIKNNQIIGKYIFKIPYLGHFFLFLGFWYGKLTVITCLILGYMIHLLRKKEL